MIPVNDKIIVRCNLSQKGFMKIGNVVLKMATLYEINYRERSPVIAEVIDGNDQIRTGDIIIAHHNTFYSPSPFHLYDDLFSIPVNKIIFGKVDTDGLFIPLCGNMVVSKVDIQSTLSLPASERKQYIDRYIIKDPGRTIYKENQLVFTTIHAGYEIVYIWQNIEFRLIKINQESICGILK